MSDSALKFPVECVFSYEFRCECRHQTQICFDASELLSFFVSCSEYPPEGELHSQSVHVYRTYETLGGPYYDQEIKHEETFAQMTVPFEDGFKLFALELLHEDLIDHQDLTDFFTTHPEFKFDLSDEQDEDDEKEV